jgi:16S rRNA (guanine966-N2)-methyltransferase
MRIIAGTAGGIHLTVPRGDKTRPTSDRTRGAIFSSLGSRVMEATVLDLFAGSGGLGLEAASRGARSVVFVEEAYPVIRCIEANIAACQKNLPPSCQLKIRRGNVFSVLKNAAGSQARFDLVLADPPYGPLAQQVLDDPNLPLILSPTGTVVLESGSRLPLTVPPAWRVLRDATYGDTHVSMLTRAQ